MPRPSKHPREFRERCVRIARKPERPVSAVARGLGIHETLRVWVRQDEAGDGSRADRLATAEREEFTALRREVRDLRRWEEFYNVRRPHSGLKGLTPYEVLRMKLVS